MKKQGKAKAPVASRRVPSFVPVQQKKIYSIDVSDLQVERRKLLRKN